jgi:SAM-dependent methyltransferase
VSALEFVNLAEAGRDLDRLLELAGAELGEDERRRHARVLCHLPDPLGVVTDVGPGGAFVVSSAPPRVGAAVTLAGGPARVAWHDDAGFGARVLDARSLVAMLLTQAPRYAWMMRALQRARAAELRAVIDALPPARLALEVACGASPYSGWLEERGARVVGLDVSAPYLRVARREREGGAYLRGDAARLPFPDGAFDLTLCAHSLFSLPDGAGTIAEMARVTRPGGHVVVLEADTLHEVVLPWPAPLELAVRAAELRAATALLGPAGLRFYAGRDLRRWFRAAGLDPVIRSLTIDRAAPLARDEERFLELYFADLRHRIGDHLAPADSEAFAALFEPDSPAYLFARPDFQMIWIESLAIGMVPRESDAP